MVAGKNIFIKYLCCGGVIFVCSFASLLFVAPFGAGVFMGLVLCGLNPFLLAVVYVLCSLCFSFNWLTLLGATVASIAIILVKTIDKFKKLPQYLFYLLSPACMLGFLPLIMHSPSASVLFLFFTPITMLVTYTFFNASLNRGLKFKMLDSEYFCGAIILILLALGLNRLDIYYFPTVAVFCSLVILFLGKIYGFSGAMIGGICMAIGGALFDYQLIWFAYYPVMALLCGLFLPAPRILSALSSLIGYTLITFFFEISAPYAYLWLSALFLGGIIYTLVPIEMLKQLKSLLNPDFSPVSARKNVNLLREETASAIFKTGDVFVQMSAFMSGEGEEFNPALNGKLREGVCSKCQKNANCLVTDQELNNVLKISIEKGSATIVDLPDSIISECRLAPALISYSAGLAESADKKREKTQSISLAKSIVSEQLLGMGEVLKQMSYNLKTPVSYDFEYEQKIKEELNYRGVCCMDALISPNGITLTLNKADANIPNIEKILFKLTKIDYRMINEEQTKTAVIAFFAPAPIYDAVFSVASCPKGEVSGDTHSFVKIGTNKFLVSLCDGMGSGREAQKYAFNTVSLIECFYKAGFDHATVIKSVNRFLSLSREECFTACDICVIDLNLAFVDIFKIGSPACFIKSANNVKVVEGSSLPLGAFEDVRPSLARVNMANGDMLILLSDGVADCFDLDTLLAEISACSYVSCDQVVKHLLNLAKSKQEKIKDDMTVTAVRIFANAV